MNISIKAYRYLIVRRFIQLSILLIFAGGNYWGWKILNGNYSHATLLDTIQLFDPYAFLQVLASGFIGTSALVIGAVTIAALYAILGGRIFCGWICPMNIITSLARSLRSIIGIKDNTNLKISRNLRYWLLGISLVLSALLGIAAFEIVSPISMLHRGVIFGFGIEISVILVIFFFDLTILKDGWCGHICPLGAFYSILGRPGLIKVKHIKDKCTSCMRCFVVCPEEQVLSIVTKQDGLIKSGECLNCARCIEVCDDKALRFSINKLKSPNY